MATLDQVLKLLITADEKGLRGGLQRATGELKSFGNVAGRIFAVVSKAFAAIGVGLSAGSLLAGLKQITGTFDDLAKSSQKVGIGVESLSKLKYAADLSGLSFEQLESGLKIFSRNLDEGRNGSRELQVALNRLGITARDTNEQALLKIADTFQKLPDGAEKTAIAMRLFGRSGADLVPLLNAGSEGIRQFYQEAERLGIVVSTQSAKAAEEFNDNVSRLGTAISGLGVSIANNLLPFFTPLAEAMANAAKEGGGLAAVIKALGEEIDLLLRGSAADREFALRDKLAAEEKTLSLRKKRLDELNEAYQKAETFKSQYFGLVPGKDALSEMVLKQRKGVEEQQAVVDTLKDKLLDLTDAEDAAAKGADGVAGAMAAGVTATNDAADAITNLQTRYKKLVQSIKEGKAEVAAGPVKDIKQSSVLDITRLREQADAANEQAAALREAGSAEAANQAAKSAERFLARAQAINDYLFETGKISKGYYQAQADLILKVAETGQAVLEGMPLEQKLEIDKAASDEDLAQQIADRQVFAKQNPLYQDMILRNAEAPTEGISVPVALDSAAAVAEVPKISEKLQKAVKPVVQPMVIATTEAGDLTSYADLQAEFKRQNPGFATGGLISGPGTPTSDSILARLSDGEFVVRAAAVRNYGLGFLERLNSMALPRFATGGMVSAAGTPVNIHLPGGQSFGLTAQPSVAKQLASILSTEVLKRGRR